MELLAPTIPVQDVADLAAIAAQKSAKPEARVTYISVGKRLRVCAITPEVSVEATILDCEIKEPGKALVNSLRFANSVKTAEGEQVSIAVNGTQCVVQHGGSRHEMATGATDVFHDLDADEEEDLGAPESIIGFEDFLKMLKRTKFACSTQPGLWAQHSILIESLPEEEVFRMIATDGRRLALAQMAASGLEPMRVQILPQGLLLVEKLAKKIENHNSKKPEAERPESLGFLTMCHKGNILEMTVEEADIRIRACLATEEFPPWESVMPDRHKQKARVNREHLLDAVKEVISLGTSKDTSAIYLDFSKDGMLTVSSAGTIDSWKSRARVGLESYTGEPVSIAVSPSILKDGLSAASKDCVELRMNDSMKPVVLTEAEGDFKFTYVMLPIKV